MTVYLIGAGRGDPGLLTVHGAELLATADVVLHDQMVSAEVLALAGPGARLVDIGAPGAGAGPEVGAALVDHGRRYPTVVRLYGGDPCLPEIGPEEAQALGRAGVAVEVVPGVIPALADLAAAGVPATQRQLARAVTVVPGFGPAADVAGRPGPGAPAGGPPAVTGGPPAGSPPAGAPDWEALARVGGTVVVPAGAHHPAAVAAALLAGGRSAATPVAVVPWYPGGRRQPLRTTLGALADVECDTSVTVVVGTVAALDLRGAPRPLQGRRVVVTRPRAQAGSLVRALQQVGASVVALPVVTIAEPADGGEALAAAARRVADFAWVGFASANAVDRFLAVVRDGRDLAGVRLAAVGAATARALAAHHLVADLVPDEATAEALAAAFPAPGSDGRPVLFPRAAEGRTVLADRLRAAGWDVEEVDAYRTLPANPHQPAVAAAASADVVTFTAPSTVAAFVTLVGADRMPPVVACIGPVTAEAARRAGLRVDVVAADHSAPGLVAALVDLEARRPAPAP